MPFHFCTLVESILRFALGGEACASLRYVARPVSGRQPDALARDIKIDVQRASSVLTLGTWVLRQLDVQVVRSSRTLLPLNKHLLGCLSCHHHALPNICFDCHPATNFLRRLLHSRAKAAVGLQDREARQQPPKFSLSPRPSGCDYKAYQYLEIITKAQSQRRHLRATR